VVWEEEAEDEVYRAAKDMGNRYVPDPPLVQMQNVRVKVARMAVAIASRTFSAANNYETVLVRPDHVRAAVRFIDHIYGLPSFGYAEISRRTTGHNETAEGEKGLIQDYLVGRPDLARFLAMTGGKFRSKQMQEQLSWSNEEASSVICVLAAKHMIRSEDEFSYRITPPLNEILRRMNP
jgi:hypothetical protein